MAKALVKTDLHFDGQKSLYEGKVRDVYDIDDKYLAMVVTDRISAFDVVLPKGIPFKGQVLNQIAAKALDATTDICPNWKIASPDPMVTVGYKCQPFAVEMIVRGYLTGSSWRDYKAGARSICGVPLPEGMREHQKFEKPIITPTTKAELGLHDENISKEDIIARGLVSAEDYAVLEKYAMQLFERGTEIAAQHGLILVDTKYEFGKKDGEIYLIDEVHTPDSSRYFYADGYQERFDRDEQQRQLSKEFVREWLMEHGFQGRKGDVMPELTDAFVDSVSERYIELYEHITGEKFDRDVESTVFVPKGQWITGISISYSQTNQNKYNFFVFEDIDADTYTFKVTPMLAYAIKNDMAVGLKFAYTRSLGKLASANIVLGQDNEFDLDHIYALSHNYYATAIFRNYFSLGQSRRFGFFNEIQLQLGGGQTKITRGVSESLTGTYETNFSLDIGIVPGLMVFLSDWSAMEVNIGVLGFSYHNTKSVNDRIYVAHRHSKSANFKINLFSITFGTTFYL